METSKPSDEAAKEIAKAKLPPTPETEAPEETGGPKGLEPTRFGDWEVNGRCSDF